MSYPDHIPTPSICETPPILTRARLWTGILAVLMSSLGLWMSIDLNRYPCEHDFHHQIDSPVLAIELASTREEVEKVLNPVCATHPDLSGPKAQQRAHSALLRDTIADCFFIPLYTLFIWSFGSLFAVDKAKPLLTLRRALTLATIATATAAYVENTGIFRLLHLGPSDMLAQFTSWPSRLKWTMLAFSLLLTAVILVLSQNRMYSLATRRLLAIGYIAIGTLLAVGLWRPAIIGLAMKMFALIVLLQIVALLGPYFTPSFPPDTPTYEDDFCEQKNREKIDLAVHE